MKLRKHQNDLLKICGEILDGKPINTIIASVTPGGGKSAMPVILADNLIPLKANRICWVVPRNSLKYQGEKEFLNKRWNTNHRIRVAHNGQNLTMGLNGYVTTYQAIGENPKVHFDEFAKHRYILFLDEPHHVSEGSSWSNALEPLVEMSVFNIFASGTLSRHDGKKIAFLKYKDDYVDLTESETSKSIVYSRRDALSDGAITKLNFDLVDGHAEWKDNIMDKETTHDKISSWENGHKALYAALRTEYAYELMYNGLESFKKYLNKKPDAKMLVVAPNIEYAKRYQTWLTLNRYNSRIATSEDSIDAMTNINDYKRGAFNVLVTVAMAYEGLSVEEISHLILLTFIRSTEWLEQCFARLNRLSPNKNYGLVFAPKDPKLLKAMKMINNDQSTPLEKQPDLFFEKKSKVGNGIVKPWIHPLASKADGIDVIIENHSITPFIAPSEQEKILREEINKIRNYVINGKKPGGRRVIQKVMNAKIRREIGKTVSDASIQELEKIWLKLRKDYLTN